jgi:hypothetical protein
LPTQVSFFINYNCTKSPNKFINVYINEIKDLTRFSPTTSNNTTTGFNNNIGVTCSIRNEQCEVSHMNRRYDRGCLTFSPNLTLNNHIDTNNGSIILNITNTPPVGNYFAIKFNYAFINNLSPPKQELDSDLYPFNQGSLSILEFNFKIRKRFKNLLSKAYGFSPKLINAIVNVKTTELQQAVNSPTILILKPSDNSVYVQEETFQYTSKHILLTF